MVITPLGSSPNGVLHCATVLLFSKIFPALINFTSFAAFGVTFLSDNKQNCSNYITFMVNVCIKLIQVYETMRSKTTTSFIHTNSGATNTFLRSRESWSYSLITFQIFLPHFSIKIKGHLQYLIKWHKLIQVFESWNSIPHVLENHNFI